MAIFWPFLEVVFDSLFKSTYLNLGLLKKGSKKDPKKRVNFGVKNGQKWVKKWSICWQKFQIINLEGIFVKNGIYGRFIYIFDPLIWSRWFSKVKKGSFLRFFTFFAVFSQKCVIFDTFWQVDKFIVAFIRQKWQKNIVFVIFWKRCFVVQKQLKIESSKFIDA